MSVQIFWRLETAGDLLIRTDVEKSRRFDNFDYLAQISRAAELTGFDGLLVADHPAGEDPWVTASVLASHATRLGILPVFSPAFGSAVYAAKMTASFQRFSANRLGWGLRPTGQGDAVAAEHHYDRFAEFLAVARGVWSERPFSYTGQFFAVENGGLAEPLAGYDFPAVYLFGSDKAALEFSARHGDVHVFESEPLDRLQALSASLQVAAAHGGRKIEIALAVNLLARESADEAWDEARHVWSVAGNGGNFDQSRLGDHWWRGVPASHTAPATLVGSYAEIIAELSRYADAGVTRFIFGATPQLEDVYRIGEFILPALVAHAETNPGIAA